MNTILKNETIEIILDALNNFRIVLNNSDFKILYAGNVCESKINGLGLKFSEDKIQFGKFIHNSLEIGYLKENKIEKLGNFKNNTLIKYGMILDSGKLNYIGEFNTFSLFYKKEIYSGIGVQITENQYLKFENYNDFNYLIGIYEDRLLINHKETNVGDLHIDCYYKENYDLSIIDNYKSQLKLNETSNEIEIIENELDNSKSNFKFIIDKELYYIKYQRIDANEKKTSLILGDDFKIELNNPVFNLGYYKENNEIIIEIDKESQIYLHDKINKIEFNQNQGIYYLKDTEENLEIISDNLIKNSLVIKKENKLLFQFISIHNEKLIVEYFDSQIDVLIINDDYRFTNYAFSKDNFILPDIFDNSDPYYQYILKERYIKIKPSFFYKELNKGFNCLKPYYILIDTETNGLPNELLKKNDLNYWPRLIQLAYHVYSKEGFLIIKKGVIVRPEGFVIKENSAHSINHDKAMIQGINLHEALDEINYFIEQSVLICGHNIKFDINVLNAEMNRLKIDTLIKTKGIYCTMEETKELCNLSFNEKHFKYPTLAELYYHLFEKEIYNLHDAITDIQYTADCFWELKRRNFIDI